MNSLNMKSYPGHLHTWQQCNAPSIDIPDKCIQTIDQCKNRLCNWRLHWGLCKQM